MGEIGHACFRPQTGCCGNVGREQRLEDAKRIIAALCKITPMTPREVSEQHSLWLEAKEKGLL